MRKHSIVFRAADGSESIAYILGQWKRLILLVVLINAINLN